MIVGIQAGKSADPQNAGLIFIDDIDAVVAQTVRIVRVGCVPYKPAAVSIKSIQTTTLGSDPQYPSPVFQYIADIIIRQCRLILGIMFIYYKIVTVVPVQSILGSKP